ncbi:hypothetical protein [Parvibaculum sp.]|mgnify:FL=1|jgi:hypothetical protein|uniref:hypothetical protein n=1 Tax=Parvibaculum sp. TaxID=2024848 RepID=UPI000C905434|nr:hypothetical protein [Parvibaculum sp.]MAB14283.1 hypothetical protein [Parvibaculum sp.]
MIQFTEVSSGEAVWVNPQMVAYVKSGIGGHTVICFAASDGGGDLSGIFVKEAPEEVCKKLEKE